MTTSMKVIFLLSISDSFFAVVEALYLFSNATKFILLRRSKLDIKCKTLFTYCGPTDVDTKSQLLIND